MPQARENEERSMAEVEAFVRHNIVVANDKRALCGDGRPVKDALQAEQLKGALRVFGGDFGIVMVFSAALKGLGEEVGEDEIVDRYLNAKRELYGQDEGLDYHTDSDHPIPQIGCGHVSRSSSSEFEGVYSPLTSKDVKALYLSFIANPASEVTILTGRHGEKGVLYPYGASDNSEANYSVNSSDETGMYFVVDMQRAKRLMEKMAPLFSEGLRKRPNTQELWNHFIKQMQSTAGILAGGLPQYKINIANENSFTITQLAKVDPIK